MSYYYDPNNPNTQPSQQPPSTWYPPTQLGQHWMPPPPPPSQYPQLGQMCPPPPYSAPSLVPPVTKPYSPRALYVLIGLYAFSWLTLATEQPSPTDLGVALWMGIMLSLLILDARGLVRLQGAIKMSGTKTLIYSLLALGTWPFWLGIYFICTFLAYHRPPLAAAPVRRKATVAFFIGTGLTLFVFVSASANATTLPTTTSQASKASSANTAITATATPAHQAAAITKPTPKPAPKVTPTPVPAAQPIQAPVPRQAPVPTQPPAPTYSTDPAGGSLVYNPPADFCENNACVSTFWTATRGYVVECANGEYSHSGGVSGACSRDGGVMATLYQHG